MKSYVITTSIALFLLITLSRCTFSGSFSTGPSEGCTDPQASNYYPGADIDDGSCNYIDGCTDERSINYNPDAGRDDGTCEYELGVVFWYRESLANALTNAGIETLQFVIDGEDVGTHPASDFVTSRASCGDTGAFTYLGVYSTTAVDISFSVSNADSGQLLFQGDVSLSIDECEDVEFIL